MRKNIKQVLSSSIIILSVMFGFVVYAEEGKRNGQEQPVVCTMDAKMCPDGSYVGRSGPNCEFVCPTKEREENREAVQKGIEREEFKDEVRGIKNEAKASFEEKKTQLDLVIQNIKIKRDEFKTEMENSRDQAKIKINEARANLRVNLNKIKDEVKKESVEKIVNGIQLLNAKLTNNYSDKINQIDNVLVSIESRIAKAENRGLDVSSVKTELGRADSAIAVARETISAQTKKVYEINITDDTTLKTEMKNLRDTFSTDIRAIHSVIKMAHTAVRNTATALAKIPKIDEETKIDTEVEDNKIEKE